MRNASRWSRLFVLGLIGLIGLATGRQVARAQIQMNAAEFAEYDHAVNKVTEPLAQAAALEAYLDRYPNSAVKLNVLQRIMIDYANAGSPRAVFTAGRVLELDPNSLQAYVVAAFVTQNEANALADPAARQAKLESVVPVLERGVQVAKSSGADPGQRNAALPVLDGVLGNAALGRKDMAEAIRDFTDELDRSPVAETAKPGNLLQDTFYLAQAYSQAEPPDYEKCAYYAARATTLAPAQFKSAMQPLATWCYRKFHGSSDGYEGLAAVAQANLHPPANLRITAAPRADEIAAQVVRETSDLAALAISDKEYILANGRPPDASAVWKTIQGKRVTFPGVTVLASSATELKVAVSEDALSAKTPDYTVHLKSPIDPATVPPGSKVTVAGTYRAYTASPLMISIDDADLRSLPAPVAVASAVAPPPPPPVRRQPAAVQPDRGVTAEAPDNRTPAGTLAIPHNYALVFATNHYDHWPQLQNPIPDGDAFAETLKSLYGFQVDVVRDATDSQILQKLNEYLHRTFEPQDQLLIFFSGHGYFDPDLGQGFLVPANAETVAEDFAHRTLLAHDTVMRYVNRIPAQHVVLILDACFAGTLDRKIAEGGLRGDPADVYVHASLPELLERKEMKRTRRYFASGGKDFVPDGLPGHHSPFMSALLVTLNQAADQKGYVTLNDLQQGLDSVKPEPRWGDIEGDNDPGADFLLLTPQAVSALRKQ